MTEHSYHGRDQSSPHARSHGTKSAKWTYTLPIRTLIIGGFADDISRNMPQEPLSSRQSDVTTDQNSNGPVLSQKRWSEVPFGNRWRAAVIRLPRYIPKAAVRLIVPEGPYPRSVKIPSRFKHHNIPVWIFLPPSKDEKSAQSSGKSSNGDPSEPNAGDANRRKVPIHIDFHGGNFIMGGPLEQAPFCARIARDRGYVVLGVDYLLGPVNEYPSSLKDAEDVIRAVLDLQGSTVAGRLLHQAISRSRCMPGRWNYRNKAKAASREELTVDPTQLSLSGFSSGGNLALNLLLSTSNTSSSSLPRERERDDSDNPTIPLHRDTTKRQNTDWLSPIPLHISPIPVLLFYPQLEQQTLAYDRPAPPEAPIARPGKFGSSVEKRLARGFIPEHIRSHPRASPGLASPSAIHEKARFFVVLPEHDSLTYHAYDWVRKMRSAGWTEDRLRVVDAPQTPHGFFNQPDRKMDRRSLELKEAIYAKMMDFWTEIESQ